MDAPLVSIFCFVRNRREWMQSCIESVLNQTYPNIEFVIQDGASTDGTLEIIQSYQDSRIKLVSASDRGPADAMWLAFRRCQGELIGSCLSDEELAKNAVQEAVNIFKEHPHFSAIIRDTLITDEKGEGGFKALGKPFNIMEYMSGLQTICFPSAFFRKSALDDIGLQTRSWNMDCGEYEFWCRLGLKYEIAYCPGIGSKYTTHPEQLTRDPLNMRKIFFARMKVLSELYAENPQLFSNIQTQLACKVSNGIQFADFFQKTCGRQDLAEELLDLCKRAMSGEAQL